MAVGAYTGLTDTKNRANSNLALHYRRCHFNRSHYPPSVPIPRRPSPAEARIFIQRSGRSPQYDMAGVGDLTALLGDWTRERSQSARRTRQARCFHKGAVQAMVVYTRDLVALGHINVKKTDPWRCGDANEWEAAILLAISPQPQWLSGWRLGTRSSPDLTLFLKSVRTIVNFYR